MANTANETTQSPSTADQGLVLTRPPAAPAVERLVWSLAEVALALGNVSTRTVKRLAVGELAHAVRRVGRRRLFDRKAIEEWVRQGCPRCPLTSGRSRRARAGVRGDIVVVSVTSDGKEVARG